MRTDKINNIGFKAGLTRHITQLEKNTNPENIKAYFRRSPYTDWGDFKYNLEFNGNKAYALACRMCAIIFTKFRKVHNYRGGYSSQNFVFPKGIYVFNDDDLDDSHKYLANNFFTTYKLQKDVLRDGPYLDRQTICLNNLFNSLEEVNYQMNENKSKKLLSSGHFLHFFVHEWIHSIASKLIYNITNDQGFGDYDTTKSYNFGQKVCDKENEIVADILGEYSSRQDDSIMQYSEIFTEAWTKFICSSLDRDCISFKKDPIDELKKTPKEFREILKKVSTITLKRAVGNSNHPDIVSWNEKIMGKI